MSTVITQQAEETEQQLIDMAVAAVRQSNWTIGEVASKWTERYASGRTDADFAELIGISQPAVNLARRVHDRFLLRRNNHEDFTWTHWRTLLSWQDAEECLDWAEATDATFAEMNAWHNVRNGRPPEPEPVKAPTQHAPEPHDPIVHLSKDEPEPSGEVAPLSASDTTPTAVQTELDPAAELPPVDSPKPHVANNSGEIEWYTPAELIDASREVMGDIDLDPASCETANEVVNAAEFYDKEQDGLSMKWHGRVFMNPPYAAGLVGEFIDKLLSEFSSETVSEVCVLVNNATETRWFQALADSAEALCFPKSRIRFWNPNRDESMTGLQGQAVVYLGPNVERFRAVFSRHGVTVTR